MNSKEPLIFRLFTSMSIDSESPSPSPSRDWFFPSPSFIHPNPNPNPRRCVTNPRISRPPKPSSFQSFSHSSSKYAGIRRRVEFARRTESLPASNVARPLSAQKPDVSVDVSGEKKFAWACAGRFGGRWRMAILAAVSVFVEFVESVVVLCEIKYLSYLIWKKTKLV